MIALDLTKVSPVTDEESETTESTANGVVTAAINRIPSGPSSGTVNSLAGTRTMNFLSGIWALFGQTTTESYLPAGFKLHWFGLRVYDDAADLPDLSDEDVIALFTNAGIGPNGENWPGGPPQLFFRDDASVWNSGAGAPNRGTLATVPNLVLNGSGSFG